MIYLNQILFKYYENLGICYILYYLDIHQKELKYVQPLSLNPGARLLFVGRSICKTCKGMVSQNRNPSSLENSEVESAQEVFMGHDSQIIWGYSHITHRNIVVVLDADHESNLSGI